MGKTTNIVSSMRPGSGLKSKESHPADLNNTTDKYIMECNDDRLPQVPDNVPRLEKYLNIKKGNCPYCDQPCEKFTMDEIVPCKDGGRYSLDKNLNMIEVCNTCNRSKGGKSGIGLEKWIREGPNKGESKIPKGNQEKMIQWINENRKYICTDNPIVIETIKTFHNENKSFFENQKEKARIPCIPYPSPLDYSKEKDPGQGSVIFDTDKNIVKEFHVNNPCPWRSTRKRVDDRRRNKAYWKELAEQRFRESAQLRAMYQALRSTLEEVEQENEKLHRLHDLERLGAEADGDDMGAEARDALDKLARDVNASRSLDGCESKPVVDEFNGSSDSDDSSEDSDSDYSDLQQTRRCSRDGLHYRDTVCYNDQGTWVEATVIYVQPEELGEEGVDEIVTTAFTAVEAETEAVATPEFQKGDKVRLIAEGKCRGCAADAWQGRPGYLGRGDCCPCR